jgi:hypothetical protein
VIYPFYEPIMTGRVWGLAEAASGDVMELAARDFRENIAYLELS